MEKIQVFFMVSVLQRGRRNRTFQSSTNATGALKSAIYVATNMEFGTLFTQTEVVDKQLPQNIVSFLCIKHFAKGRKIFCYP